MIRQHKPFVLVGSPECTAFSSWQHLNEKLATADQLKQLLKRKAEAKLHLNSVVPLYIEQIEGGRYFLHEHPSQATSWVVGSIAELQRIPGVGRVVGDQCQFGAEAM